MAPGGPWSLMRLNALSHTRIEQEPPRAAAPASHCKEADRNGPEDQACQGQRQKSTSIIEDNPNERSRNRSGFAWALGLRPAGGWWNAKRGAFRHNHPWVVPTCRLAQETGGRDCGHGKHGSILDPLVRDSRQPWIWGSLGQCTSYQQRARPKDRHDRLSVDSAPSRLRIASGFLPAFRWHLPTSRPDPGTQHDGGTAFGLGQTNAKISRSDECLCSSCGIGHHRAYRNGYYPGNHWWGT